MPETISIKHLPEYAGREIMLRGWLYGVRSGGKIFFLQMRDGTGICQCLVEAAAGAAFQQAAALTQESSFTATGTVRADPRAPGGFELVVSAINIIQPAEGYPISRKAHGIEFLMNQRHLWLRSRRQTAILRIRHTLIKAIRDFFDSRDFTLIDTPILIKSAAEGAGTLFPVDYFGERAYLAQTGQLYLECACMALGRVYCFGPTFRAEKSKTRRHLTEFWMVEPEVAFADLDEVMQLAEDLTCSIVPAVCNAHHEDLALLERDLEPLAKIAPPFPRITYSEAVEILHAPATGASLERELEADRERLKRMLEELHELESRRAAAKKGWPQDQIDAQVGAGREAIQDLEQDLRSRPEHIASARSFQWGQDIGGSDETILSRHFDRPVFITDYPREVKAFYMKQSQTDPRVVRNADLLAPEGYGEIIGGSQREDDLDRLLERLRAENLKPEDYGWYLDLRRYGSVPHGGFGLGLERMLAWLCGLRHVRETIPFPRLLGRMVP